jgi:cell cycle checkpoint control protein RAD9A
MELALSGSLLRSFFKSVGCLAKIGAEVLVEASAGTGLTLKSMNSARSAFCSVTFKQSSFEVFAVPNGTVQTAVLAKHLAAALRTQRLERVVLSQAAGESSTLRVRLECSRSGLTKHYGLHCVTDAEHLKATVDASLMPISLILKPKEFSRLLSHFQSAQTDVTVSFTPEQTNHPNASGKDFSGGFGDRRHEKENSRNLRLSSFADPNAPPGQHLQTSIGLDAAEDAVLRYTHEKDASETAGAGPSTSTSTDVTVNLKDLRAMVQFCESVDLDVAIYADSAGAPLLVRPCAEFRGAGHGRGEYGTGRGEGGGPGGGGRGNNGNYFDAAAVDFDAELVLASMLPRGETLAAEPSETLGGTRRGDGEREDGSVAPTKFAGETAQKGGRSREVTERGAPRVETPRDGRPSMDTAVSDSEAGGSQPGHGRGEHSVGAQNRNANANLKWAPGAPANAAETDDWDWDGGDDFVEATPPEKRRRV